MFFLRICFKIIRDFKCSILTGTALTIARVASRCVGEFSTFLLISYSYILLMFLTVIPADIRLLRRVDHFCFFVMSLFALVFLPWAVTRVWSAVNGSEGHHHIPPGSNQQWMAVKDSDILLTEHHYYVRPWTSHPSTFHSALIRKHWNGWHYLHFVIKTLKHRVIK